ncbi:hypothetical protein BC831DRAFT_87032 [Entophlyctis helioformis]|nr:hypothetical protein BC831DRAFT_87032 [Entophlyctis helioformis]
MLTLLLISLNNTWVILLGKQHVSRGQIGIGIAVVWLVTVGYTCMVMIIPGGGFVKQPSSFHCGLDAVSTHPIAVAIRLMTITIMICTPICICVFYVMITLKLRASSRDLTQLAVAPPSPNATPRSSLARLATEGPAVIREGRSRYTSVNACVGNMDSDENTSDTSDKASMLARKASLSQESRKLALQVALVKRAVALVTAFLLSWVPYLAVIMHGAITLVNISPLVEAVSAIFASCGALLNPVLLMVMDTRYREAFLVLIGRPMPYLPTWNDRT